MLDLDIIISVYEEIAYYFRFFDPNHFREDTVCLPSTQFATYNKIQSEKELLIYLKYGHERLPYLMDMALHFFLTYDAGAFLIC
ncbi:hypothetical protein GCM10011391_01000 [Pullulanibacillus camelliae]|uniref:Acetyl xylan esterase domain-containing protein n=1 Tax=Pullulanibacillus camelliae TaxID=1707096 RepID=A0A8J2Y9P4_9BACL|nr:hypothetical protein GCM10011391_01000 [Pullulanibacillus camelliae]